MKITFASAMLFMVMFLKIGAAQTLDLLDKQVTSVRPYQTIEEAVHEIEKATELKISCPGDTMKLTKALWTIGEFPRVNAADAIFVSKITVRRLLDTVCSDFGLNWRSDPTSRTVIMDLPWRVSDPRSRTDLFRIVWKPGHEKDLIKDGEWLNAFDALICKDVNFEKACQVRQRAILEKIYLVPKLLLETDSNAVLEIPVVGVSGEKYMCVFLYQLLQVSPGHGNLSYYWFKNDGTLVGAGLISTGDRCDVASTIVAPDARDNTRSDVRMILEFNGVVSQEASFVLEKSGLKLNRLTDKSGNEIANLLHIGESLLE